MPPTAEPAQLNHRATYREVLAEPRFRLLFSTRTVAITAGALRITTFSFLVFAATGSAPLSALAFGIGFLPQLFGSLLLGSLAHRLPPRALIAGGYTLECAAALLLALVRMPIAASLGVVALVALATPVFSGASSRLVAQWLKGDAYVLGRSLNNIAASGAQLFGLALGGAVVAVLGPRRALAASAALYLGCALAIRIRLPPLQPGKFGGTPADARADGGAVRASLYGAGLLLRGHTVRRLILAQWLPPAFTAGAEGLIVAYAGGRHFAPGWYAVLMGCLLVGMLVGDLLVGRLLRPPARERLVIPLIALMGLPLVGFAAEPGAGVSSCLLLLCGFGFAYGLGLQRPFLDALPEDGQGQAFGLLGSGGMTLQGIGPACFGAAAAGIGTGGAIALAGGAAALTAGWILTWHPPASPLPSRTPPRDQRTAPSSMRVVLLRSNRPNVAGRAGREPSRTPPPHLSDRQSFPVAPCTRSPQPRLCQPLRSTYGILRPRTAHGRFMPMIDEFAKDNLHTRLRRDRKALLWKLDGLSEYDARRPLTATGTNLLGLVKHVATVEARYFGEVFDRPSPEPLSRWQDSDGSDQWAAEDESRDQIIAFYRRTWEHSDATIDELPLDAPGHVPWWPEPCPNTNLFAVMVHVLGETNRHAGHADILREGLDGRTGMRPEHEKRIDEEARAARWAKIERAARSTTPIKVQQGSSEGSPIG